MGAGFVADSANINGGYPILKWQKKTADGKYDYDKDEADGLDIAATGIENATAKGFTAKMTARLEYTKITTGDFTLKVTVDGQEVKPENLSSTVTTDDEATTVAFSWKELPAEKDVVYSVQFKQNPAKTLSFTLPASDSWIAYAADGFAGGDGSKDDPYRIETVNQLAYFGRVADAFNNKYIVLVNDLDLGGKYWMPKDFAGIFDGQGHTISNLQVREGVKSNWWSTNSGFFALLGDDNTTEYETKICYVQNLTLKDANVDTAAVDSGAILAGRVGNDVIIENCHVSGKITAKYAGGLVGKVTVNNYNEGIDHDYIRRCSVHATVIAPKYYAGGLVSQIDWGNDSYGSLTIEDCYVTGLVQGGYAAGGFLGQTERNRCVTIDHSFVTANVLAPGGTDKLGGVGGFAGRTGITGSHPVLHQPDARAQKPPVLPGSELHRLVSAQRPDLRHPCGAVCAAVPRLCPHGVLPRPCPGPAGEQALVRRRPGPAARPPVLCRLAAERSAAAGAVRASAPGPCPGTANA